MHAAKWIVLCWFTIAVPVVADEPRVESGPTLGEAAPELKVLALAGNQEGEELDFVVARGDKPTVYALVNAARFDRPMARFLKKLDEEIDNMADTDEFADAAVVAVWLTGDQERHREYLPRVQQSIKLKKTSLCLFPGSADGPNGWGANPEASLTVAIVRGKKPTHRWGFVSTNETLVSEVCEALKKSSDTKE